MKIRAVGAELFHADGQTDCCILRGPGRERIVDIVPGGTELELQLRRGVWQAAHAIIPTSSV